MFLPISIMMIGDVNERRIPQERIYVCKIFIIVFWGIFHNV